MRARLIASLLVGAVFGGSPPAVAGQSLTQRGFVDGSAFLYPQSAPNDDERLVGDALAREEVVFKPAAWVQFAGGLDVRANSHGLVDDSWQLDFSDRTRLRPRLSVRRLSATLHRGRFTLDAGKQFIRWGKTDIVTPTDRFAPRDFMTVVTRRRRCRAARRPACVGAISAAPSSSRPRSSMASTICRRSCRTFVERRRRSR
jgi:hypothetical protein